MRSSLSSALVSGVLLLAYSEVARAEPPPTPLGAPEPIPLVAAEPAPATPPSKNIFKRYADYLDKKLEFLLSKPLWGLTASLPEGVFKVRYEYNPASANYMFDGNGNKVPLLPNISFSDFPSKGDTLTIKPRVQGKGAGHTFQFGYGITDKFNAFIEFPFTEIDSNLKLDTSVNGRPANPIERGTFEQYLTSNGRPLPSTVFDGGVDLGDMQAGVSWNFHRTEHVSAGITPRMFLPTGVRADPNADLSFLLGPEIDRGTGAFALGMTHNVDLRPYDWLTFSLEAGATYRFGHDRPSPKWLPVTACKRVSDPARRKTLGCNDANPNTAYDRATDLDASIVFPDLAGLEPTYHVEPALSYSFQVGFIVEAIPIPIQWAYNFQRNEALQIHPGTSPSMAEFSRLSSSLQLFAASEIHSIGFGISLPLFPLYIPGSVTVGAKMPVAGKNTIILLPNISVAFELYLPIGDAWMDDEVPAKAAEAVPAQQALAQPAPAQPTPAH